MGTKDYGPGTDNSRLRDGPARLSGGQSAIDYLESSIPKTWRVKWAGASGNSCCITGCQRLR